MKKRKWFKKRPVPEPPEPKAPAEPQTPPELRTSPWEETFFEEHTGWTEESETLVVEEWKNRCYVSFYEERVTNSHGTDSHVSRWQSEDMTLREGLEKYGSQLSKQGYRRLKEAADLVPPVKKAKEKQASPRKTEIKLAVPQNAERRQPEAFDFAPLFSGAVSDETWEDRFFYEDGKGWYEETKTFVASENRNRCCVRDYEYRCHNSHGTDVDYTMTYGREMTLREGLEQYGEKLRPEHVSALRAAASAVDAAETACRACLQVFFPEWECERLLHLSARGSVFRIRHPQRGLRALKVSAVLRSQRSEAEKLRAALTIPQTLMPVLDWKCIDPPSGENVVLLTIMPLAEAHLERTDDHPELHHPLYRTAPGEPGPLCEEGCWRSTPALLRLGLRMAAAIRELHELGFAHLDVKPENFFLLPGGGDEPRWVLGDLDSARELQYAHTGKRSMTRLFMPPEGVGDPCAADVYAWGVSMALLYRHDPGQDDAEALREIIEKNLKDERNCAYPDFLKTILCAMSPDPAQRYPNGRELLSALKRCGQPSES